MSIKYLSRFDYTVKPVNKGHLRERQRMVFINKWSLFGGFLVLLYQETLLICYIYSSGGLYSEVAFNTGLTAMHNVLMNIHERTCILSMTKIWDMYMKEINDYI